jgi:eukaryotic-like serine/threonine-protein kinase
MTAPGRETRPWTAAGSVTVTGMLAASELVPGDVVAGRYRVERVLGMGAMGVVFQAHDLQLDIDVALKLLRPELASRPDAFERFRQELLLARQVSSPHVVRIHDLVQHEQAWLISMDFVRGESLERVLGREGVLPVERALDITRQLALGLAVAHAKGVVHRDLKPANVMVDETGNALITDFGVARSVGATGLTASGVVVGTPAYLSPEQAQALPLDGRSDLYALGLMLYEMLTGKLPFADGTPSEMLIQRIVQSPASVRALNPLIPEWVGRLVARMLDVRLGGRFQSANDIVRAIEAQYVPRAPWDRRRLVWAGFIAVLLILAAGMLLSWRSWVATAVQSTPLDLAVLPFHGEGLDEESQQLLDGMARYLNADLVAQPGLGVSELKRVRNALARLDFDAATAMRNRRQVADSLNARSLLDGELLRQRSEWQLRLHLRHPDRDEPIWSHELRAQNAADLAAGLPAMLAALHRQLRINPMQGPSPPVDVNVLRALAGSGAQALGNALASQPEPVRAMLWWDRLTHLESFGDQSGAQIEATQARAALEGASGREALRTLALCAVILGELDAALPQLQALAANEADHSIRRLWARALADAGRPDEAAKALQHVIDEDGSDVDAWYAMGKYAYLQSDSKKAVEEYLPRAQMLATRLNDKRALADTVNLLGLGYRSLGQAESAAENLERAAGLRRELGNARGEAASLQNLAMVRSTLGDFDAADAALKRARSLLTPLGDVSAMADLENDVGVFEEERGEYRLALEAYRQSLALRQSLGDQRLIGESLLNVGFGYYQVGEFDNAQVHWERAQTLYAELDDRGGQVRARQSLGLAQIARGEFAKARDALQLSLRVAESAQMAEERAVSLLSLAELDRLEGRFADAAAGAQHAYELFSQREDPRGQVESVLLGAAIALDTGDWTEAGAKLAIFSVETIENREQQALHAWRSGEWAEASGDARSAARDAERAIADAGAAHSLGTELSARLLKARVLDAAGAYADARSELARARQELSRYASLPLRLELITTAQALCGPGAAADYREGQVHLARLPAWGRAAELHLMAARCLLRTDAAAAALADQAARAAAEKSIALATPQQQAALRRRYGGAIAPRNL